MQCYQYIKSNNNYNTTLLTPENEIRAEMDKTITIGWQLLRQYRHFLKDKNIPICLKRKRSSFQASSEEYNVNSLQNNHSGTRSSYNRASDVCMYVSHVLDRKLLERLMAPSPKSQVMFASAFSCIGDFFRIFGIHIFQVVASLLNLV